MNRSLLLPTVSATPGEVITLGGTGSGPANPPVPAGQEPVVQVPPDTESRGCHPGRNSCTCARGPTEQLRGRLPDCGQIPASMPDGDYPIVAIMNGVQSPASFSLTVQRSQ